MALARLLLVAANGALGAALLWQLGAQRPLVATAESSAAIVLDDASPTAAPSGVEAASGGTLFRAAVRPAETDAAPPPTAAAPPRLRLVGVIVGPAEAVAVVQREGQDRPERLKPGAEIDGWALTRIEDHAVVLARDGVEQRVPLDTGRKGGRDPDDPFGPMP